jgi:hypothetical protein
MPWRPPTMIATSMVRSGCYLKPEAAAVCMRWWGARPIEKKDRAGLHAEEDEGDDVLEADIQHATPCECLHFSRAALDFDPCRWRAYIGAGAPSLSRSHSQSPPWSPGRPPHHRRATSAKQEGEKILFLINYWNFQRYADDLILHKHDLIF